MAVAIVMSPKTGMLLHPKMYSKTGNDIGKATPRLAQLLT